MNKYHNNPKTIAITNWIGSQHESTKRGRVIAKLLKTTHRNKGSAQRDLKPGIGDSKVLGKYAVSGHLLFKLEIPPTLKLRLQDPAKKVCFSHYCHLPRNQFYTSNFPSSHLSSFAIKNKICRICLNLIKEIPSSPENSVFATTNWISLLK